MKSIQDRFDRDEAEKNIRDDWANFLKASEKIGLEYLGCDVFHDGNEIVLFNEIIDHFEQQHNFLQREYRRLNGYEENWK